MEVLKYYLIKTTFQWLETYLSDGEGRRLGHFSVRTEECVTLESLVLARGDEGEHAVVRCVRGAIGDPEFSLFEP